MEQSLVDKLLSEYRVNIGRAAHLRVAIEERKKALEREKRNMVAEVAMPGGSGYDDMPHGTDISKRVETIGIKLADGWISPEIISEENEILGMGNELTEKETYIAYVDGWMSGLSEKENFVLTKQVIDKVSWREIVSEYRNRYGEQVTRDTMKRFKKKVMDKIYGMSK